MIQSPRPWNGRSAVASLHAPFYFPASRYTVIFRGTCQLRDRTFSLLMTPLLLNYFQQEWMIQPVLKFAPDTSVNFWQTQDSRQWQQSSVSTYTIRCEKGKQRAPKSELIQIDASCLCPAGWVFFFHKSFWRCGDPENLWDSWDPASKLERVMVSQSILNNFKTKTLLKFRGALHFIIYEPHIFSWWRLIAKKKRR